MYLSSSFSIKFFLNKSLIKFFFLLKFVELSDFTYKTIEVPFKISNFSLDNNLPVPEVILPFKTKVIFSISSVTLSSGLYQILTISSYKLSNLASMDNKFHSSSLPRYLFI